MPEYATNPETGESLIFEQGRWRPMTQMETQVAQAGAYGTALAAVEGATGIPGLVAPGVGEALRSTNPITSNVALAGSLGAGLASAGLARGVRSMLPNLGRQLPKPAQAGGGLRTSQGFIRQPEELLPEAAQGAGRIVRAGAETMPVSRMVVDYLIKNPNQRNLNRLAARAAGATDEQIKAAGGKITDNLLAQIDQRFADDFDTVANSISAGVIDEGVALKKALQLNQEGRITDAALVELTKQGREQGKALMDMRSTLLAQARSEKDIATKNLIQNHIDEIDDIIKEAIKDDPAIERFYSKLRARYKASLAFEKGQALGRTGDINPASLDTALRNLYGKGYRRSGFADQIADPDVANFLKGAREAQGVSVGVPSSGTAERLLAAGILGGSIS